MSYQVIRFFTDLQDNEHPYGVGDIYPRTGLTVTEERIKELSGSENKQMRPLIKEVKEEKVTEDNTEKNLYTKTEINRMSTADLQKLASENGIENSYSKNGSELKKILIEFYQL